MERKLFFKEDGTFKVMQLTDVHYTDDDAKDHQSVLMMESFLEIEKPDFVILTGDAVYGSDNLKNIHKVAAPLTKGNIPWTFVFGNHDVEDNSSREEFYQLLMTLPNFVGYHDPASQKGYGNHILPIYNQEGHLRWAIAGFDSGNQNPLKQVGGYEYVTRSQIDWYLHQMKLLEKEHSDFGVLAFQHMAVPEVEEMWKYHPVLGIKGDGFGAPLVNSGQFLAMLEEGHTRGFFFGHDHMNSFYGDYFGMVLGYGRLSGFGGYAYDDFLRGSRIFILKEEDTTKFETYEILENGRYVRKPWGHHPLANRDEG